MGADVEPSPGGGEVDGFLDTVENEQRRQDARTLAQLMSQVTGQPATMWGASIVGFGHRHYRYASGREGDVAAVGFAPRKAHTVLYLTGGLDGYADLLARLGPHERGKGCLYLKRLDDADPAVLREVVSRSQSLAAEA